MHPDFSLVLQKCASQLSLKHKQPFLYFNPAKVVYCPGSSSMSCSTAESSAHSPQDDTEEEEHLVSIVSDEEDLEEDESFGAKTPGKSLHRLNDELEDNNSICSELSVGQEHPGNVSRSLRHQQMEDDEILDVSDTHSSSSHEERNNTPSTPGENSLNPFALANTLRFPVPFGLPAATATVPANISPFQEEFLRKSHLYAEELMKHQMHLMAAARASAFTMQRSNSLGHNGPHINATPNLAHLNPLTKISQISAAAAAAALTAAAQHNKPLAPHLQHQNTLPHHPAHLQQGHFPSDTLAKLTALSKQTSCSSNSHMMSTLNQLQTQMQAHLPGLLHDNNDNLHERALKFSIDNILKADFGRGQGLESPPQTKKASHHHHPHTHQHHSSKSLTQRQKSLSSSSSSTASNNTVLSDSLEGHPPAAVLGHGHANIPPSTQTFTSSLASICTNSNDSSSTAVSSSYGSVNGTGELVKSSPSQTPTLSPGLGGLEAGGGKASGKSSTDEGAVSSTAATTTTSSGTTGGGNNGPIVWPAWVYCTRYSDRPSSGPRVRKPKKTSTPAEKAHSPSSSSGGGGGVGSTGAGAVSTSSSEDKRPRTAFSGSQLARLKHEFNENRYLTEKRRQQLSSELGLNEAQIKIWFQNKRAKLKKSSGFKNPLALQLMAQGLYNHSTVPLTREEEELQELQEREKANGNNNAMQQPATSAVSS